MKTINATLLANQKLPKGRGFAAASLADNGRLHPTRTVTSSYSGGSVRACECGTFYVRIRFMDVNMLDVQKITNPTVSAQWTTWTNLVPNNVAGFLTVGLFWTGVYVVIVYQMLNTGDLHYLRSTDLTSWTGGTVRGGLVANCNLAGVSGPSPTCGLMEVYQGQIYWQQYTAASDTWAAAESAGATFTTQLPEITAFLDTINSRYIVAVNAQGFANWAVFDVVAYTRATGSATWSSGQILFSGNGLGGSIMGISFAQRQVGGYWWLTFYRFRLWNVGNITNFQAAASNDGLFYDDALPTPVTGNEFALAIIPPPSAGTWANAYMALESGAWRLDTYTYWSGARVVAYALTTGRGGHQEGGGPNGRGGVSPTVPTVEGTLSALIDNRAGALAAPRLFSVFTLTRGLMIDGVQYGQSAGPWYVVGYRFLLADGLLQLDAVDARGLLSSWYADTAYTYRLATVQFLVQWLCALAGVHTVAFDATASWTDTISSFTHPVGENAIAGLRSLAERVPFEYLVREDGSLYFYVPAVGASSGYTYGLGAGDHMAWLTSSPQSIKSQPPTMGAIRGWALNAAPWFGAQESVTYLQFIASPPRNRVAEAMDQAALGAAGRRRTLIINDRRITNNAATTAAANATLVAATEHKRAGLFASPPNFALEPGDVISFSGSTYPATAGPWRVEQFQEHFNQAGGQPFHQLVTLKGTA